MRGALACLLVAATAADLAAQPSTANPYLPLAREQYEALRYDQARESLDQALQFGRNGPAELAEIYGLWAEVAVAVGKPEEAETAYRMLLAIQPDAQPPAGVSPKIRAPFDAAKVWMAAGRSPLEVTYELQKGPPASIVLVVKSDPLEMVAGARAELRVSDGPPQIVEGSGSERVVLSLPAVPRLTLTMSAIDKHGNRLKELGTPADPIVVERKGSDQVRGRGTGGTPEEPPAPGRPFYSRWWLWGALAAGAAGLGTYYGLEMQSDEDELARMNADSSSYEWSEAQAVLDRGERHALVANVSFAVAGALAVTAVVLELWGPRGEAPSVEPRTVVAPIVAPGGGGGVGVIVRF